MDLVGGPQKILHKISLNDHMILLLLWHILHLIVQVIYFVWEKMRAIESYLIANGIVKTYEDLNLDRVKYLGIVVDSDEARETSKVIELLEWISDIGVKKVCLYDREGVLKKSKELFMEKFDSMENSETNQKRKMDFEFVSIVDGKETVAKAANLLYKKYYSDPNSEKPFFTETYLTEALRILGSNEPDPDLILIYGPTRCHLGFPAWRIRYTEMVHMGSLKNKKFGLILKAINKYTKVKQNYGS
ncbi:hypothetical protein Lser_V15G24745 [Lactuca serriola]|uniref:ditrans,polycis-polyprenyl diphosphate synthase [(2E,6E)-farnesyldiphosphate specific] n=1 Tax=Lactuca sativa TaxID=4236 RepID=A0A0A0QP73_LACSA|nr:cis-prenyltransferase-like 2 [Lactuca sativa]